MTTKCREYFIEDGQEVDKCALGLHDCQVNSVCMPRLEHISNYYFHDNFESAHSTLLRHHQHNDGFVCNCQIGFTKTSSGLCVPLIDECSSGVHDCDPNAFCYDKQLGYGCLCEDGYDGNGFTCQFVDMCLTADCGDGFDCFNQGLLIVFFLSCLF